ncbi:cell wall metabolism sensor histidine kinase WalK [Streptomyces sp. NBC_00572]|uniref:sensor histidine kinase n=1 Tax=Streptomyces sp. NBC_00572 TaxID=2903664 RepID=UPI0022523781|nr:ATP-binding protein [Streptomyces sp. NBC_00572]MCX4981527.1 HAMP domain-containing histidine kinase [Streptomyces sp. NBC_00572]
MATLVVVAAVCLLEYADRRAGPRSPVIAVLIVDDRVGPQVELLADTGPWIGMLCVAVACWFAGTGHPTAVRLRTTGAAAVTSGALFATYCAWLARENPVKPWLVAEEALRWGLMFIGPSAGLLTAAVVWTALGNSAVRLPYRSRTVLVAAATTGGLFAASIEVLRRAQPSGAESLADVYWIALITGSPLVTLLTGVFVHVAARASLRPVEAIRRELSDITGQSLDRRVPVPPTGDVIARLAVTTNDTLDRLEQASARQQQFVADAAHELRSPLAALRAQLETALRHPDSVTDWPEAVAEAAADVVRLQTLADDLLLLASHRATAPPREQVDLAALAEDLVREHQHLPDATGLVVTCEAPAPALVHGNATRLERLLRNLLANACRHAKSTVKAQVTVTSAHTVILTVEDDGPGIPPADRSRVFDRFTRLDASRTRTSGGAGLGLPIARDIATDHSGTLTIEDAECGARLVARFPEGGSPAASGRGPGAAHPAPEPEAVERHLPRNWTIGLALALAGVLALGVTAWAARDSRPGEWSCEPDLSREEYVPAEMSQLAYAKVEKIVRYVPSGDGDAGTLRVRLRVLHSLKGEVPATLTLAQGVLVNPQGRYTSTDPLRPVLTPGGTYVVSYDQDFSDSGGVGWIRYAKEEPTTSLARWRTYVARETRAPLDPRCDR